MALETGTTVDSLVSTNPVTTDPVGQADDHLRLIKAVLKTTFAGITGVADEDNMSSDSAAKLATQQSIKAYVDSQVTAQDLDLTSDSGTIAIDLDSESLTVAGGTGIDSSATSNTVTLAIDSTVATLAGSQTLTNKTLTSPVLNTPTIGTSFTIGSATITEAELEVLDGATLTTSELNILDGVPASAAELNYSDTGAAVGTVVASKVVTVDANKDVASLRNITLTGELDAGSLDVSGDADIDGTLEADAITVAGTSLA